MSDEFSTLYIKICDEDGSCIGRIGIGSKRYYRLGQQSVSNRLPDYMDLERSHNIPILESLDDLKNYYDCPILIYNGNENQIDSILLLEETAYQIIIEGDVVEDEDLSYIREHSEGRVIHREPFLGENGGRIYTLNFSGYVGKGLFDVKTSKGHIVKIPFEVRSKKIDYLKDYPIMLEDIAEFSISLALGINSPLYRTYDLSDKTSDTAYERFLILDYIYSKKNLVGFYEVVKNNIFSEKLTSFEEMPAGFADFTDPSMMMDLVEPTNLIRMENGPIAGRFAPVNVHVQEFYDEYDIPENRLVKDLIRMVEKIISDLSKLNIESTYISDKLLDMTNSMKMISSDDWLSDISPLTRIPYESNVLRYRSGYSELFSMYQTLNLGLSLMNKNYRDLVDGYNKKLHAIYEQWCYICLFNYLKNKSKNDVRFPLLKSDDGNTAIDNTDDVKFEIEKDHVKLSIQLLCNINYQKDRNRQFKSYSIRLRPDFTMLITSNQTRRTFIVNFDAKYKCKPKMNDEVITDDSEITVGCWEYDIYKMHTYRDALIHSCASFVLYPDRHNTSGTTFRKKTMISSDEKDFFMVYPEVGAIPLSPSDLRNKSKDEKYNEIDRILDPILSKIMSVGEGTIYMEEDVFDSQYCKTDDEMQPSMRGDESD